MDKIFVDTTIWIEFFKGTSIQYRKLLEPYIDHDAIYYNGIVLVELLAGALSKKEYDLLKTSFDGFHYLKSTEEIFKKTGDLGFYLRRKGLTVPLTDLHIAAHCQENDLKLLTLDHHFKLISKMFPLKLMEPGFE